jgi:CelD/BcsL family acetyltransferase involved in cellulose biosynthesis
MITTYDTDWGFYAPGLVLFEESLRQTFNEGLDLFDFRLGDERYKDRWANRSGIARDYWVPCSRVGRLYVRWRTSSLREYLKTAYRAYR